MGRAGRIGCLGAALLAAGCAAAPEPAAVLGGGISLDGDSGEIRLDTPPSTHTDGAPSLPAPGERTSRTMIRSPNPLPVDTNSAEASLDGSSAGRSAADGASNAAAAPEGALPDQTSAERAAGAPATTSPDAAHASPDSADAPERPSGAAGPIPLVASWDGPAAPDHLTVEILTAYLAFWDSYWAAASHPVDPQHPGLSRYGTEPVRSRAIAALTGRVAQGLALRLPSDHGAGRILHIDGWDTEGAEVIDCFVDTAVLYEVSTGRVRNDEQATVVHLALMRRENGTWRVAEVFEQAIHKGRTDGCIMQPTPPGTARTTPEASTRTTVRTDRP